MKLIISLTKNTYKAWIRSNPATAGAALAYYALFSLPAMLLVIIAMASVVLSNSNIESSLINQMRVLLGPDIASTIKTIAYNTRHSHNGMLAGIVGVITILIGSIGAFSQIEDSLNDIFAPKSLRKGLRSYIWGRITAFFMIIWIGILLILSLITSTLVPLLYRFIEIFFPYEIHFIEVLNPLLSFILLTILFISMFAFLPKIKISWDALMFGSIATAALFMIGRYFIQTYLNLSSLVSVYGAASTIIGLLLWAYYSSQVFLFGAAFTYVVDQELNKE